ncbi:hypothetical protein N0Y54_07615 [Nostoc punctiforme UO1]|uniref:hypothetical protein n=1 Tax=Nostoc punctiforme TaxID=272131 RepID=UPI003094B878
MRTTQNDTRRCTSLNHRDHSHVDWDRKSAMGTVQRTGGKFCIQYGVEVWQGVFNLRLKPALDKDSDRWLLIQWCGEGIISVKNVA